MRWSDIDYGRTYARNAKPKNARVCSGSSAEVKVTVQMSKSLRFSLSLSLSLSHSLSELVQARSLSPPRSLPHTQPAGAAVAQSQSASAAAFPR